MGLSQGIPVKGTTAPRFAPYSMTTTQDPRVYQERPEPVQAPTQQTQQTQQTEKKYTYSQLGSYLKKAYPGKFDKWDDELVGRGAASKSPEFAAMVTEEAPTPSTPAINNVGESGYDLGSWTGQVADLTDRMWKTFRNSWPVKAWAYIPGKVVGGTAGAMRAGVEYMGTPMVAAARFVTGRPQETEQERLTRIAKGWEEGVKFGTMVGEEGAAASLLGGAGKAVTVPLAIGTAARGIEDIKAGHPVMGGLELTLGVLGTYSGLKSKGLFLDSALKQDIMGFPKTPWGKKIFTSQPAQLPVKATGLEKAASSLSNTSASVYEEIQKPENAPLVKAKRDILMEPGNTVQQEQLNIGQDVYQQAKMEVVKAVNKWEKDNKAILDKVDVRNVPDAHINAKVNALGILENKYGITRVVDEDGSHFRFVDTPYVKNDIAQGAINNAYDIIELPTASVEGMMAKQIALSELNKGISQKTSPALKGIITDLEKSLGSNVDAMTGGASSVLRSSYAANIAPVRNILGKMTTLQRGRQVFSLDKSRSFIASAMKDVNTDASTLLGELDKISGRDFSKDVKVLGWAGAISKLDPITQGRTLDYIKARIATAGDTPGLLVSMGFSPYVWGSHFLDKGLSATEAAKAGTEAANFVASETMRQFFRTLPAATFAPQRFNNQ